MTPGERFARILRDEARVADELSARASDVDVARREQRAADHLRRLAEDVDRLPARFHAMSDEAMREFARAARVLASH
jgi:hypothetical protein